MMTSRRFAKYDRVTGDPDWQQVKALTDLDTHAMLQRYASKLTLSHRASDYDLGGASLGFS